MARMTTLLQRVWQGRRTNGKSELASVAEIALELYPICHLDPDVKRELAEIVYAHISSGATLTYLGILSKQLRATHRLPAPEGLRGNRQSIQQAKLLAERTLKKEHPGLVDWLKKDALGEIWQGDFGKLTRKTATDYTEKCTAALAMLKSAERVPTASSEGVAFNYPSLWRALRRSQVSRNGSSANGHDVFEWPTDLVADLLAASETIREVFLTQQEALAASS